MTRARRLWSRALASFDATFDGRTSTWPYAGLRVGIAAITLARSTDWLRPVLPMEHHAWVHGLDFVERAPAAPALESPWIPGLVLGADATVGLAWARVVFALALLLGVRPRASALGLAACTVLLLAADRYRYFHHLALLVWMSAWLAMAPRRDPLSIETLVARWRLGRRREPVQTPASAPIWPLQVLRAFTSGVYLSSGCSKLAAPWLHGEVLAWLDRYGMLGGAAWTVLRDVAGVRVIAPAVALLEIALGVALLVPPTRRAAVGVGLGFHAALEATLPVSTFGAQMALLLTSFLPKRWPETSRCERRDPKDVRGVERR